MAQYPGPNIVDFKFIWTYKGYTAFTSNLYYEQDANSLTDANISDVAQGAADQIGGVIAQVQSSAVTLQQVRARVFQPNNLLEGFSTGPFNGAIDIGGDSKVLPFETAAVIQITTGKFGRSNQGRIFISGLAPGLADGEIILESQKDLFKDIADTLGQDLTLGGVTLHHRLWNRKQNSFIPVRNCFAVLNLKSQRRRRFQKGQIRVS